MRRGLYRQASMNGSHTGVRRKSDYFATLSVFLFFCQFPDLAQTHSNRKSEVMERRKESIRGRVILLKCGFTSCRSIHTAVGGRFFLLSIARTIHPATADVFCIFELKKLPERAKLW